ncbi:MAG: response regulator [Gammaproteobacteria bacterium]|nr:response regulator [Gammaproteobacteria bacterium]
MQGNPINILLVEDEEAHAVIVKRNLDDFKLANKIWHVTDGQAALDYLYRREDYAEPLSSPRPDLILLDLRLPRVDGLEVLKIVKSDPELVRIPVVVMTTSAAEKDITQAYDNYANSYLVKPLDLQQFMPMLKSMGFYWLIWNQSPNL